MITIRYEPDVVIARVEGADIRQARLKAGFTNSGHFAQACGWNRTQQLRYEQKGTHEIPLERVLKMIQVCNDPDVIR